MKGTPDSCARCVVCSEISPLTYRSAPAAMACSKYPCAPPLHQAMRSTRRRIFARESLLRISRDLPVHLISGERDPVHDALRGFHALARALRATGHQRVSERVFPDARHELLNETNRDEVTAEILAWLGENLETPQR